MSKGYSSLGCAGFSLQWLPLLQSTGPRERGFQKLQRRTVVGPGLQSASSVVVVQGSMACGVFLDQESNLCILDWQEDFFTTELPGKPSYFFSVLTNLQIYLSRVLNDIILTLFLLTKVIRMYGIIF